MIESNEETHNFFKEVVLMDVRGVLKEHVEAAGGDGEECREC